MADSSTPQPAGDAPNQTDASTPLFNADDLSAALKRIAAEIIIRNRDVSRLGLVGLPTRGVTLAERIAAELKAATGVDVPVGQIDITFHRDDLELRRPVPHLTQVPFDVTGRVIVLVDDVLFSGRSVRAAMDALIDLGRPEAIQLATLIDRGHRRLPIAADYVGRIVETGYLDDIRVKVREVDGTDCVEVRHP